MEDDLNFFCTEDDLNFVANQKMTLTFLEMEEDLNFVNLRLLDDNFYFFVNGRRPQLFSH